MRSQIFRACLGVTLSAAFLASAAQAQPSDKRTYFTFSGPIALPGVTLPAGRYVFRIVDDTTSRRVIQVLSDDEKKPYAMMNTIPDQRRDPVKDATVSFYETPAGSAAAVKSWWYPGESIGYQFIFPRTQARQIAKNTGKPVLTTKAESNNADDTKSGTLTRVDASGRDVDVNAPDASASASAAAAGNNANATASNNANNANSGSNASNGFRDSSANSTVFNRNTPSVTQGANRTPPQVAQNAQGQAQNPVPAQSSRVARNELPKTASSLPLVGLIGMLAAFGFVAIRFGTAMRF